MNVIEWLRLLPRRRARARGHGDGQPERQAASAPAPLLSLPRLMMTAVTTGDTKLSRHGGTGFRTSRGRARRGRLTQSLTGHIPLAHLRNQAAKHDRMRQCHGGHLSHLYASSQTVQCCTQSSWFTSDDKPRAHGCLSGCQLKRGGVRCRPQSVTGYDHTSVSLALDDRLVKRIGGAAGSVRPSGMRL